MLKPPLIFIVFLCLGIFVFAGFLDNFAQAQSGSLLPTSVEIIVSCGDGLAEAGAGEVCDPGEPPLVPPDVGTSTCQDFRDIFGDFFASGDLGCQDDCLAFATTSCYTCGNTKKENAEECDSSDFGGQSCISFGYVGGSLVCMETCRISTANCESMDEPGGIPGGGSSGGSSGGSTSFQPGSDTENETKVVVCGKSYPHSDVHILADGKVIGIVNSDAKADFYFETDEVTAGVASFSFWSEDSLGLKSTLLTLTFRVISGSVTTITGVYIAPTIDTDRDSVRKGEDINIFGETVPDTEIFVHIHSEEEHIEQSDADEDGKWNIVFNTEPLEEDFHTAKALFQIASGGNVIKSGFSKSISFHVGKLGGEAVCPGADLNDDGKVNLVDFSILLFHWGSNNEYADQNLDGTVDLIDFSIMMFYWTG
ncbi:MAG: dockerin type I domain-containing protein [Patescibacteria group bacterium]|nr:dockerin type I domain-containing protein [Patescibacteria group bacterium]